MNKQNDDSFAELLDRASELIRAWPLPGVLFGTLLPALMMINHSMVERLVWKGWLFSEAVWISLCLGAASAMAGLGITLYSLRAMLSIPVRIRPFIFLACFVVMMTALYAVHHLFRG